MHTSSNQKGSMLVSWKSSATRLRLEAYALYLAFQDPRVPWYARAFTALIVGYTFSPIDLIPDFIPVLGYLDDLVIVPLGIALAIKMVPREVLEEYRVKEAKRIQQDKPVSWFAAVVIILLWVAICILIIIWVLHKINR